MIDVINNGQFMRGRERERETQVILICKMNKTLGEYNVEDIKKDPPELSSYLHTHTFQACLLYIMVDIEDITFVLKISSLDSRQRSDHSSLLQHRRKSP
jgi:hypothetical protein